MTLFLKWKKIMADNNDIYEYWMDPDIMFKEECEAKSKRN